MFNCSNDILISYIHVGGFQQAHKGNTCVDTKLPPVKFK